MPNTTCRRVIEKQVAYRSVIGKRNQNKREKENEPNWLWLCVATPSLGLRTVTVSDGFTAGSDGHFPVPSEVRMHTVGPVRRDPLRPSYGYLVDSHYFPIING